jgi:hypothetical protein
MHRDSYGRTWEGPFPFTIDSIREHAPTTFGVYEVLYLSEPIPVIAYIGVATGDTIRGRLSKHVRNRANWALGRLSDPNRFAFVYYMCDSITAQELETHICNTAKPPFNVRPEYKHWIPSIALH